MEVINLTTADTKSIGCMICMHIERIFSKKITNQIRISCHGCIQVIFCIKSYCMGKNHECKPLSLRARRFLKLNFKKEPATKTIFLDWAAGSWHSSLGHAPSFILPLAIVARYTCSTYMEVEGVKQMHFLYHYLLLWSLCLIISRLLVSVSL